MASTDKWYTFRGPFPEPDFAGLAAFRATETAHVRGKLCAAGCTRLLRLLRGLLRRL